MISIFNGKKRILVFMADEKLFGAVKFALKQNGFVEGNQINLGFSSRWDLAFIDRELVKYDFVPVLREKFPHTQVVLVRWDYDGAEENYFHDEHELFYKFSIPLKKRDQAPELITKWFSQPEGKSLLEDSDLQFGSGLWTSLMHQVKNGNDRKSEVLIES